MNIVAIILEALLALAFLGAAGGKLSGAKTHRDNFQKWGFPQWFRIVTGLLELVGAAALIVGFWIESWAAWGGIVLAIVMIGGIGTHIRAKDSFGQIAPSLVLAILAIAVALLNRAELLHFPG